MKRVADTSSAAALVRSKLLKRPPRPLVETTADAPPAAGAGVASLLRKQLVRPNDIGTGVASADKWGLSAAPTGGRAAAMADKWGLPQAARPAPAVDVLSAPTLQGAGAVRREESNDASSDAAHAAAIFGAAPRLPRPAPPVEAEEFCAPEAHCRPEGAAASDEHNAADGKAGEGPIWATLGRGDPCTVRAGGAWQRGIVRRVTHQGYSNARYLVAPEPGVAQFEPLEVGAEQLRAAASRPDVSAEPCTFFNSAQGCRRGASCRFAHVRVAEQPR